MRHLFYLLFFLPIWGQASIGYFIPPDGWECVHPQNLSPHVSVGFLGPSSTPFRPSINLAVEKVNIPLKEYIKAVKEIHKKEMRMQWRDLGSFRFLSGKGRLGEITSKSPFGEIKMLQAIYVENDHAYILTGAVLKEDFAKISQTLLNSIRSFRVINDLLIPIENIEKKERIEKLFSEYENRPHTSKEENERLWRDFQKIVETEYPMLGSHWQFLALKEAHQKIFSENCRQKESIE